MWQQEPVVCALRDQLRQPTTIRSKPTEKYHIEVKRQVFKSGAGWDGCSCLGGPPQMKRLESVELLNLLLELRDVPAAVRDHRITISPPRLWILHRKPLWGL